MKKATLGLAMFLSGLLPAALTPNPALASSTPSVSWVQANPATAIFPRRGSMMTYDSGRGRVVLFGGTADCSGCNNEFDTYEWDGSNWNLVSTPTDATSRYSGALAYDAATHNSVLFGGAETGEPFAFDTWTYDGSNWTFITGSGFPPGRFGHVLVYDPASGNVVLFGGTGVNGLLSDTWTWNGASWSQLQPANSPPARTDAYAAYDPTIGRIVVFGGTGAGGALNDTWEWDGSNWSQIATANSPSPRQSGNAVFDSVQGRFEIFGGADVSGGLLSDTWTLNTATGTWAQMVQSVQPAARRYAAMSFDALHGYAVMFGGQLANGDAQDTWNGIYGIQAALSPSSLNLGQEQVGHSTPANQKFATVTNTGVSALAIYGFAFGGTDPNDFTLDTNNCFSSSGAFMLAPQATCTYGIGLSPTAIGTRTGTFVVQDDAPEGSQAITLTGVGLAGVTSLSPTSLNFGSVKVTGKSATKTVTLTNVGNESVHVTTAAVQGVYREDFMMSQDPCNNATLAPGKSCKVTLFFKPSIVGVETATLAFTDDAAAGPQTVALSGTGTSS